MAKYIPISKVVNRLDWSTGLKQSMIEDFVTSKYGNVAPLMGEDERQTSQNIQKKVDGFASEKNTYLQANMLAKVIHEIAKEDGDVPKRKYTPRAGKRVDYPMGDVLKDCAGWTIYKKVLPDGRIVYNAKIKPETAPNRDDWNAIKGEVYTGAGFKWGKFGAFEKWGEIPEQEMIINKLCEILGKYYDSSTVPKTEERLFMVGDIYYDKTNPNDRFYISSINSNDEVGFASLKYPKEEAIYGTVDEVNVLFRLGKWVKVGRYDNPEQAPDLGESSEFIPVDEDEDTQKQNVQKAIRGLQYLADKGNEKAIKAIKGLQYLLKK